MSVRRWQWTLTGVDEPGGNIVRAVCEKGVIEEG